MKLARHLAERIAAMRYEDLPPEAVYWSRIAVLDTIGVALAGSVEAPPRLLEGPPTRRNSSTRRMFDAEVKVALADGRSFSAHVDRPLGRTSEIPIPPENLRAKFENCASRVLPPKAVAAVTRAIEAFEEVESVRGFTKLLEPASAGAHLEKV